MSYHVRVTCDACDREYAFQNSASVPPSLCQFIVGAHNIGHVCDACVPYVLADLRAGSAARRAPEATS